MSARLASTTTLALVLVGACPSPGPAPVTPGGGGRAVGDPASVPADAPPPSQEETLAAIQKAMNELDEAAQGCWAAAAVQRFDVEGDVTVQIQITPGTAVATTVADTTRNPQLVACLATLLGAYRWAPPLYGQTIQLPFRFRAPAGQNVIDRTLVPWNGQGALRVAALLDDANTGNDAASILEVALAAGATTDLRKVDRTELWYFLGPATVGGMGAARPTPVVAGDMAYVPAGGARELRATGGDVHAILVLVPGGREGTARAGALPTPPVGAVRSALAGPRVLRGADAQAHGPATIYAEPAITGDKALSASVLALPAGTNVPEHVHANETELLYVLEGAGTMTIAGVDVAVTPTSVIQIPPDTKHAFVATAAVRAVQVYTPAGPEQRFKTRKASP